MRRRARIPLVGALLVLGCATWVGTGGPYRVGGIGVEADLPAGWMRKRLTSNELLMTRDGLSLDYIHIYRRDVDDEVPNTQQKLRTNMLPQQVAELSLDSTRLADGITNFEVLENSPAEIDGHECYKLSYRHRVDSGLRMRTVEYGCLIGRYHYHIVYRAPAQHYFDEYVEVFERVRRSIRFKT